ncbi:MAG: acyl carrier protein [Bacteroidia bacterium]|jgi:acyl carrier protein|nr:acyl carrier protein [Bacteroidia bacterium]
MPGTIDAVKEKIKEVAFKKVNDGDELFQSGILSSILVVDLATSLEDEFGISIPFTEITLENFSTAEKISAYIDGKKA